MSDPVADTETRAAEVLARIDQYEEEWGWLEATDDTLAGYGHHMSQMLYRLPRDGQTVEMQASIESMLRDLRALAAAGVLATPAPAPDTAAVEALARVEALRVEWDDEARQAWADADRLHCGDVIADQRSRHAERLRAALAPRATTEGGES